MLGIGEPNGIMIVQEYSTPNEFSKGVLCYGTAKKVIDTIVKTAGNKLPVYWTTAIKTQGLYATPKVGIWKAEIAALQKEILEVNPQKILCLGTTALSMVLAAKKVMPIVDNHGRLYFHEQTGALTLGTYNPYKLIKDSDGADYYRDIFYDVQKLIKSDTINKTPEQHTILITNPDKLQRALELIYREKIVSCDIETEGKNFITDRLNSIGFGLQNNINIIVTLECLQYVETKELLTKLFTNKDITLIFHNCKFDVKFILVYLDCFITCNIQDTILLHYALDERPIGKFSCHSLKDLARLYFDANSYGFNFNKWKKTPEQDRDYIKLYEYQSLDTYYTLQLYKVLKAKISQDKRLLDVYNQILIPATLMYCRAELKGINLDIEYLQKYVRIYDARLEQVKAELKELGYDFNPFSPKQVHEIIESFGVHASARRDNHKGKEDLGTGQDELKQYIKYFEAKEQHDYAHIVKLILAARKYHKYNQTYFKALIKASNDGRLRTEIRILGTATGRTSSSEPNLQNIPAREGKFIKSAFRADIGYTLIQADYKQLELRIAAYLAKDADMANLFKNDVDMHKLNAGLMFKKDINEVTEAERYLAKAVGFGILYGRGAKALAVGNEMDYYVSKGGIRATIDEMQQLIDNFMISYKGIKNWIDNVHEYVLKNNHVRSIFGRVRRFEFIPNDKSKINEIKRASVNTPVQSAASDLCLSAAIMLDKIFNIKYGNEVSILLTVHDSIIVQCRDDLLNEVIILMKQIMTKGIINVDFIPFDIDIETGKAWGKLNKLAS